MEGIDWGSTISYQDVNFGIALYKSHPESISSLFGLCPTIATFWKKFLRNANFLLASFLSKTQMVMAFRRVLIPLYFCLR